MPFRKLILLAFVLFAVRLSAQAQATPVEGDFTLRGFRFESGETLPEMKLHYRALAAPRRLWRRALCAMPC